MSIDVVKHILEQKKKEKKRLRLILLSIVGFVLFVIMIGSFADRPVQETKSTEIATTETSSTIESESRFIPGLFPVDVFLNLEKEGFKTEKISSPEYGNSWTNKRTIEGIEYRVTTFSMDVGKVESVQATAMVDPSIKKIIATQPFLFYIASLPYEGAQQEKVQEWIKANFNNDKASIVVSGVKFTIYAPTQMLRMLNVEKD